MAWAAGKSCSRVRVEEYLFSPLPGLELGKSRKRGSSGSRCFWRLEGSMAVVVYAGASFGRVCGGGISIDRVLAGSWTNGYS